MKLDVVGSGEALPEEIAFRSACDAVGGKAALARGLGISNQAISQWAIVPPSRVLEVEALSGVSRHALCPSYYPVKQNVIALATGDDELDSFNAYRIAFRANESDPTLAHAKALVEAWSRLAEVMGLPL